MARQPGVDNPSPPKPIRLARELKQREIADGRAEWTPSLALAGEMARRLHAHQAVDPLAAEHARFADLSFAYAEGNHFGREVTKSTVHPDVVHAADRAVGVALAELGIAPFRLRWFERVSADDYLAAPQSRRSEFLVMKSSTITGAVRAEWAAWVSAKQSPQDAAGTVLHEARHLWQRVSGLPEAEREPDAYAYAARYQDVIAGWTYHEARAS